MAAKRKASASSAWHGVPHGATVVVDTAPIICLLEDHPEFAARFVGLFEAEADQRIQIAISTITIAEVLAGPFKNGQDTIAGRYERALRSFDVIAVSTEIAVHASRLRARYGLKLPDALQLATALETGAYALVTHDRDFSRVQGIEIITGAA